MCSGVSLWFQDAFPPTANDVKHLLLQLFAVCIFSLEKCLFVSSEAYVIFCPVHLRRIKFGRMTVAFYFFVRICGITINNNQCVPLKFIMHGHDTQSHPFHTSIDSLL